MEPKEIALQKVQALVDRAKAQGLTRADVQPMAEAILTALGLDNNVPAGFSNALLQLPWVDPDKKPEHKPEPKPHPGVQAEGDDEDDNDNASDYLYPAERQDMIADFIDAHAGQRFRREDIQDEFGFSRDQTQRDLKTLRDQKRIGYKETNEREPNPQNPNSYRFRRDAVYYSLQDPRFTFPMTVTFENREAVLAFIKEWENA